MSVQIVQEQVKQAITDRLADEAEKMSSEQGMLLLKLAPNLIDYLVGAHGILYARGLHSKLDLTQPIIPICWRASNLLGGANGADDGEVFAAQRVYESTAELLAFILLPPEEQYALVKAAMAYGAAQVIFTHAATGIWQVMAEAMVNEDTAKKITAVRSAGGAARGAKLKAKADAWKAEAMPVAEEMDRKHPEWTRSKLDSEIIYHFDWDRPGQKVVEDWLKDEAEEPNGRVRSRSKRPVA